MKKRSLHGPQLATLAERAYNCTEAGALNLAKLGVCISSDIEVESKHLAIYSQLKMAMRGSGNAMSILVFVVALLAVAAQAKNHDVGGTIAWDYPAANDPGYYDTWASKQTFLPGDTLTFTYTVAQHDATVVTAAEYTSCAMTTTGKKYTSGKDVVTLPMAGTYYFYCSIMGHCEMGMKMKVTVAAAAAPVLPPARAPTPLKAPTPAPIKAPTPAPLKAPTPSPVLAPGIAPVLAPVPVPVPAAAPAASPEPPSSGAVAVGVCFRTLAAVLFGALFLF